MLVFTSTGWRRAGYTGRHINGWLRANCSTESGKSFVLPNSLPGWLVILLGHWRGGERDERDVEKQKGEGAVSSPAFQMVLYNKPSGVSG
ncbi:hypothetical protein EYF80_035386 [Liparis tanakae]|uniref:Uncharacterized protein n=1 Tax=Liparis tanakae TaxID=230148 RepID=A0A4Z2GLJ8_9TELE|nr:hypothetical protein EYF80_035386 [Liparis tanakae]